MSCPPGSHHFAPGSLRCDCGQTTLPLAPGALPYPSWRLESSVPHLAGNNWLSTVTDGRGGPSLLLREYLPEPVADTQAQFRRFIETAKALRSCPVRSARVLFPYTRNGRCYTVAEPVQGTPLSTAMRTGSTPEPQCLGRLLSVLTALKELHAAGTAAGPLFHGDLRPEHILIADGGDVHLVYGLYLENLLREQSLPPEHFQAADLAATGDLVLALAQGTGTVANRPQRLDRIADPVLGAALEHLLGRYGKAAPTADAALHFAEWVEAGVRRSDSASLERAFALCPSPRLQRFRKPAAPPVTKPPASPAQPTKPAQPAQPAQPVAIPVPPPAPVSEGEWLPVSPPPLPPGPSPNSGPKTGKPGPKPRGGCGGCLLTLLLAGLVAWAVYAILTRSRPAPVASLDFTAEPNPAARRSHVHLRWSSSGFDHLELDGQPVASDGNQTVTATSSHRYVLVGFRPDGSRVIREVNLAVLSRRPARPAPTQDLNPPPKEPPVTNEAQATPPASTPASTRAVPVPETAAAPRRQETPLAPSVSLPQASTSAASSSAGPVVVPAMPPATTPYPAQATEPAFSQNDLNQVNSTLHQWSGAMLANDSSRAASFYAPQLDRYFKRSGVSQEFVRQYLAGLRSSGRTFTDFRLSDPVTTPEPDGSVEVRFNEQIALSTPSGPRQMQRHSVLRLRRLDGTWKIVSERDFEGAPQRP